MALLWIDGFENYGTAAAAPAPTGIMSRTYTVSSESLFIVKAGRLSEYAISIAGDARYFYVSGLTTDATLVAGFAVKFVTMPDSNRVFFSLYDGATQGINLRITLAAEIAIYRGTTLIATTSGLGLQTNTWYYIELKILCDNSGTYELRVGGDNVLSDTGVDTQISTNAYYGGFRFSGPGTAGGQEIQIDDLYVLDGSGSVNNDFLGNMRVVTIRPDANNGSPQFTPDTGDNYARVNEVICGDDTNYVEADTTDEKDLYDYGTLGGVLETVAGIMVTTDCRETDANNFSLKTVCKSGATESDDAGQAIGSTNYVTRRRVIEIDPNTVSDPWNPTTLEAAQFGIKIG